MQTVVRAALVGTRRLVPSRRFKLKGCVHCVHHQHAAYDQQNRAFHGTYCSFAVHMMIILLKKKKDSPQQVVVIEKHDTSYRMAHGHSLVVGYSQKYGLRTINTIL
jgi:hypothetical protein